MLKKSKFLLLVIGALFPIFSSAQTALLNVGDKIPDINLNKLVNCNTASIALGQLKGKIIILDFGGTTCGACVKSLPDLNTLQKKYNDNLQIFWVTNDPSDRLQRFCTNNRIGKTIRIPMIAQDTLLNKYFPHIETPYEVWIDQQGIVTAFTDPKLVDEKHIVAMINRQPIEWPFSGKDITFDRKNSMLTWSRSFDVKAYPSTVYHSIFTNHFPGFLSSSCEIKDTTRNLVTYLYINYPILELYWQQFHWLSEHHFEPRYMNAPVYYKLNVKDTSKLLGAGMTYFADRLWNQNHTFCYEASFPLSMSERQRRQKIVSDLNTYSGFNANLEDEITECWVLRRVTSGNNFETVNLPIIHPGEGAEAEVAVYRLEKEHSKIVKSVGELINYLNKIPGRPPLLDETGLQDEGKLGIKIEKAELTDLELTRKRLAKYGLDVEPEMRKVQMFVITDAN